MRVPYELAHHNAVVVRTQGLEAVPELGGPELHVLVRGPGGHETAVTADVEAEHRQLVAVEGEVEFQSILKVERHGGVEETDSQVSGGTFYTW